MQKIGPKLFMFRRRRLQVKLIASNVKFGKIWTSTKMILEYADGTLFNQHKKSLTTGMANFQTSTKMSVDGKIPAGKISQLFVRLRTDFY